MKAFMALLAVAALVAGCGGSGGGSSTQSSTQSAANVASTSSSSASTAAPAAQPTFASTGNCQQLADLGKKYVAQIQAANASGQLNASTELSAAQAMADASPSEIHSDAEYVVHKLASFFAALSKAGYTPGSAPTASQMAVLLPLLNEFKSAQMQAAINHIDAWIRSNCHGVTP